MMDPRDARNDDDWFDVLASEDGVFGCIGLMACHDVCPKELPLLEVYSYLRRKTLAAGLHRKGR
jgi:fumarate reductase iron-sulfur subunit